MIRKSTLSYHGQGLSLVIASEAKQSSTLLSSHYERSDVISTGFAVRHFTHGVIGKLTDKNLTE